MGRKTRGYQKRLAQRKARAAYKKSRGRPADLKSEDQAHWNTILYELGLGVPEDLQAIPHSRPLQPAGTGGNARDGRGSIAKSQRRRT
tara:strand:+ start:8526 stop:8789 length:264 start_codon:yes stop_codon:yes gene_type:complete